MNRYPPLPPGRRANLWGVQFVSPVRAAACHARVHLAIGLHWCRREGPLKAQHPHSPASGPDPQRT